MESKMGSNGRDFSRFVARQTRRFSARVVSYGSYTETIAMRALIILGFALLCGLTLMAVRSILQS